MADEAEGNKLEVAALKISPDKIISALNGNEDKKISELQ